MIGESLLQLICIVSVIVSWTICLKWNQKLSDTNQCLFEHLCMQDLFWRDQKVLKLCRAWKQPEAVPWPLRSWPSRLPMGHYIWSLFGTYMHEPRNLLLRTINLLYLRSSLHPILHSQWIVNFFTFSIYRVDITLLHFSVFSFLEFCGPLIIFFRSSSFYLFGPPDSV